MEQYFEAQYSKKRKTQCFGLIVLSTSDGFDGMVEIKQIAVIVFGFAFAHFFAIQGLRFFIGSFKFEHLYLGIILMVLGYLLDLRTKNEKFMYLFYFGLGIALNDIYLEMT